MQRGVYPSTHSWWILQPTFEGPGGTPAPAGGTPTLPRTHAASERLPAMGCGSAASCHSSHWWSLLPPSLFLMPSIHIPTPLRKLTNELDVVEGAGANVGEVIDNLDKTFPGLKERICDDKGDVRRFVNVFVNGEDIRFLADKATAVQATDEISIVPAIAGG